MTTREVADLLVLSRWTVARYARDGVLPAVRVGAGRGVIRFDRVAIDAWISARSSIASNVRFDATRGVDRRRE